MSEKLALVNSQKDMVYDFEDHEKLTDERSKKIRNDITRY